MRLFKKHINEKNLEKINTKYFIVKLITEHGGMLKKFIKKRTITFTLSDYGVPVVFNKKGVLELKKEKGKFYIIPISNRKALNFKLMMAKVEREIRNKHDEKNKRNLRKTKKKNKPLCLICDNILNILSNEHFVCEKCGHIHNQYEYHTICKASLENRNMYILKLLNKGRDIVKIGNIGIIGFGKPKPNINKGDFVKVIKSDKNIVCGISSVEEEELWSEGAEGMVISKISPDKTVNVMFLNGNYTCEDTNNRTWSVHIDVLKKIYNYYVKNGVIFDIRNKNIDMLEYIYLVKKLKEHTKSTLNSNKRKYYLYIDNDENMRVKYHLKNIDKDKYYYLSLEDISEIVSEFDLGALYLAVKNKFNGKGDKHEKKLQANY